MIQKVKSHSEGTVIFLLLLFGVIWYNNTYNQHNHILSSGRIIVHSHPYKDYNGENSPFKNHQHSGLELISINTLNLLFFTFTLIFIASFYARIIRYFEEVNSIYDYTHKSSIHERAPPHLAWIHV